MFKGSTKKIIAEGLTYDDVLLIPQYSEILPKDVNLTSKFSKNIEIKIPIVSAAMDTVTNSTLAIAIAQEGGIGVLHKNMSIEAQGKEVRKVKRSESGIIRDPITLYCDSKVSDAIFLMKEHSIGGIPVIGKDNHLKGIVTNRDLRFKKQPNNRIDDIMTINLITIEWDEHIDMEKAEEILLKNKIEKLPIVDSDYRLKGLVTFRDISKSKIKPNACKDQYGRLRVAAAVGITDDMMKRVDELVKNNVDAIVIDTAHGHSKGVIEGLKKIKKKYNLLDVVVGNIATGKAAKLLLENGADGVKVGIGPGSICTTRVIAGVGVPQLSAVLEVAKALEGTEISIIADGGIRFSGDIVKALAAGASSIMVGGLLAGVEESPGDTIFYDGKKFKLYRGMGSIEAMQHGSKDRYFQENEEDIKKLVPEGISGRTFYKGMLSEVVYQLIGGIRSGMGYCGAANLMEIKKAKFIKISSASFVESHPHNIVITRESPNYSK